MKGYKIMLDNISQTPFFLHKMNPVAQSFKDCDSMLHKALWLGWNVVVSIVLPISFLLYSAVSVKNFIGSSLSQRSVEMIELSECSTKTGERISFTVEIDDSSELFEIEPLIPFRTIVEHLQRESLLANQVNDEGVLHYYHVDIMDKAGTFHAITKWIKEQETHGKEVTIGDLAEQAKVYFNNTPLSKIRFELREPESSNVEPSAPPLEGDSF